MNNELNSLESVKSALIIAQSELITALYDESQTQEQFNLVACLTEKYVILNNAQNNKRENHE